ncbi:MAG: hypothetical protein J6Q43_00115 [Bacteroidaceae bacterium]|nr:hypothetical protein [Bacteroidaceae bacterium]MBQ2013328.1 hypothetical protein [Bacteroidaceae bacterium]
MNSRGLSSPWKYDKNTNWRLEDEERQPHTTDSRPPDAILLYPLNTRGPKTTSSRHLYDPRQPLSHGLQRPPRLVPSIG